MALTGTELHSSHDLRWRAGVYWCTNCGAWARAVARKLASPCEPPTESGLKVLDRLKRGLSVKTDVPWDFRASLPAREQHVLGGTVPS